MNELEQTPTANIYIALRTLGSNIEEPDSEDPKAEEVNQTKMLVNEAATRLELLSAALVKMARRLDRCARSRAGWKARAKDAENFIELEQARQAVLKMKAHEVMQTLIKQNHLS